MGTSDTEWTSCRMKTETSRFNAPTKSTLVATTSANAIKHSPKNLLCTKTPGTRSCIQSRAASSAKTTVTVEAEATDSKSAAETPPLSPSTNRDEPTSAAMAPTQNQMDSVRCKRLSLYLSQIYH